MNTSVCSIGVFTRALYMNVWASLFSFLNIGLDNRWSHKLCILDQGNSSQSRETWRRQ